MKSVLISIKPKYCELIASGKKTIEVRKTKPKLDAPFKCYIYMTEGNASYPVSNNMICHNSGGKCVIGEFVCGEIIKNDIDVDGDCLWGEAQDCLTDDEFEAYIKNVNVIYGWHISDLKIYDKPKELSEFKGMCKYMGRDCCACPYYDYGIMDCKARTIKRPPQSWCYVEELR